MIGTEFSNEFDTLLNSYSTVAPYGGEHKLDIILDEYEKSVFLTKAQEDIIIESYTGKNQFGESFERTEEIRKYLNELVKTETLSEKLTEYVGLSDSSVFFKLPEDVWFITYESVILADERLGCSNGEEVIVIPVTQDEYYRIVNNPFRGPSKNKVVRLDINDNIVEIVSYYTVDTYRVRYLSTPTPIILTDLEGITINNIGDKTECKLNPAIHRAILERAVKLAIISKTQVSGSK